MSKVVTLEELKANSSKDSIWLLLDGKVYNVSKFLDEHPGGDEVILAEAGKDATEAFEDVGHSDEARALLPDMLVGTFDTNSGLEIKKMTSAPTSAQKAMEQGSNMMYFVPLALMGGYFAWRYYSGSA
ncbi:cytochrome b5 [Gymnopus androsaceus JB14]|uniref:Cytochrome b5 n=1 Tax=Gymnopus androsaceus JB14 TaxID=1447944 RepID=A0A6A4I4K3_9AGAR|nr:cytochrome b5 [Gymnopus androsaceus JB14]